MLYHNLPFVLYPVLSALAVSIGHSYTNKKRNSIHNVNDLKSGENRLMTVCLNTQITPFERHCTAYRSDCSFSQTFADTSKDSLRKTRKQIFTTFLLIPFLQRASCKKKRRCNFNQRIDCRCSEPFCWHTIVTFLQRPSSHEGHCQNDQDSNIELFTKDVN